MNEISKNFQKYFNSNFLITQKLKLKNYISYGKDDVQIFLTFQKPIKKFITVQKINCTSNLLKGIAFHIGLLRLIPWDEIYQLIKIQYEFETEKLLDDENEIECFFVYQKYFSENNCFQTINVQESIELSQTLLNNNSLKMYQMQNFERFLELTTKENLEIFLDFKDWINKEIENFDKERFLFFGSFVLWAYGLRKNNDFDVRMSHFPYYPQTFNLDKKIEKLIKEPSIPKIDFAWIGYFGWTPWTEERINDIIKIMKINSIEDLFHNPDNYFYFLGVKVVFLEYEILRRQFRVRAASISDLIMIKLNLFPTMNLFPENVKNVKRLIYDQREKNFEKPKAHVVQKYLKERYNQFLSLSKIEEILKIFDYS